jgi:glycosyltransferase involved in cell wall biosynthesis
LHNFLESLGHTIHIVEISGAGGPYYFSSHNIFPNLHWHCLFPEKSMDQISSLNASKALWNKLEELKADVLLAGAIAYTSGATAVNWAKSRKKSVIIFDDSRLADVKRNSLINLVKQIIYNHTDAIFCPSEAWNETFYSWGFQKEQIFYGVDVIDNEFFSGINHTPKSETNFFFLAVGRQIPIKNHLFLLKAYEAYVNDHLGTPYGLVFIGEGIENKTLSQYIVDKKLERVKLIPFVSQPDLKKYYLEASALVHPSKGETWGLVVNEAMASGLPVLISNQCGCASTLVKEGLNGYTFSPENRNELTHLLGRFASLSAMEQFEMGKKSQQIISDWGLERFCNGAWEAIQYVTQKRQKRQRLLGKLVLKIWKGRYRPV